MNNNFKRTVKLLAIIIITSISGIEARRASRDSLIINRQVEQLQNLKGLLLEKQNVLSSEIEDRWSKKQEYIEARNFDKEKGERLKLRQERLFEELARNKEEGYTIESKLTKEKEALKELENEWLYTVNSLSSVLKKEADRISGMFPLGQSELRKELEFLRRENENKTSPVNVIKQFSMYAINAISHGMSVTLTHQPVLVDGENVENLAVLRIGSVAAYGVSEKNEMYSISQTGQLGPGRFAIRSITDKKLCNDLNAMYAEVRNGPGVIVSTPFDILQNAQSESLLKNNQQDIRTVVKAFIKAGGPIMYPLLFLPIWALTIVAIKMLQIANKRRTGKLLSKKVITMIENKKIIELQSYIAKKGGSIARIIKACIDVRHNDRCAAEKAVKEIIMEEIPQVNRKMNTLAVLAAVAPLMGLLGTVSGMISLFKVITIYGTGDPQIMAGGISEALITTQAGLVIAIPILLLHNFLQNRQVSLHIEMEKCALKLLNRIWIS